MSINNWAKEADDLLIYMADHGGPGMIRINRTENLDYNETVFRKSPGPMISFTVLKDPIIVPRIPGAMTLWPARKRPLTDVRFRSAAERSCL